MFYNRCYAKFNKQVTNFIGYLMDTISAISMVSVAVTEINYLLQNQSFT